MLFHRISVNLQLRSGKFSATPINLVNKYLLYKANLNKINTGKFIILVSLPLKVYHQSNIIKIKSQKEMTSLLRLIFYV